jgi:hypothetical protein
MIIPFEQENFTVTTAKIASTLVFYDWTGPLNWEGWGDLCNEFFGRVGATPNSVGYRQGKSSRKVLPKTLAKVLKKPNLDAISLYQLRPPFDDFGRHAAYACFRVSDQTKEAIFSYDSSSMDAELFSALTKKFSKLSGTTYGIGYLRLISRGPTWYSAGICYDSDDPTSKIDKAQKREITRWFVERSDVTVQKKLGPFPHLDGFLRDVYPFNVLTAPHLHRMVFGQPLAEWISSDAEHGQLREVADGVWTWVLFESQLPAVRNALITQGLLIAKLPAFPGDDI